MSIDTRLSVGFLSLDEMEVRSKDGDAILDIKKTNGSARNCYIYFTHSQFRLLFSILFGWIVKR